MLQTNFIGPNQERLLKEFSLSHLPPFFENGPKEVWHYTTADGLIKILESSTILATQVACLNDTTEHRYLADLTHKAIKPLALTHEDLSVRRFLAVADKQLSQLDMSSYGRFVACFSAAPADDLAQWRGYGGGECGYAIAFDLAALRQIVMDMTPRALMAIVQYINEEDALPKGILRLAVNLFQQLVETRNTDLEACSAELLEHSAYHLGPHAAAVKAKAFSGEHEHRIIVSYDEAAHGENLLFRQRRTMLSRHLPVSLAMRNSKRGLMPLTRIMVGPGPAMKVSKISVGDLLQKRGYENVPVQTSNIPYRVP